MKKEALQKPPALLLPPPEHRVLAPQKRFSFNEKERVDDNKAPHKFSARYDTFHGILKRVSDMKLSGSLGSEEPSTESEKSGCSTSKARVRSGSSSADDRSNVSTFEDESSVSSVAGSDHCPPYEDISNPRFNRYSCVSLPSPPPFSNSHFTSFDKGTHTSREDYFSSCSPTHYQTEKTMITTQNCFNKYKAGNANDSSRDLNDCWENLHEFTSPEVMESEKLSVEENRNPESITDSERLQLEMFFRSLKTQVFVCGCLANLYVGWTESEGNWTYKHTGIIVVILDSGDTRSRRKRKIQILLAERGTCFPLWKDTIDNLSAYRKSGTAFHTMHLSSDHRQLIGFSFDSPAEAEKLVKHIEELTSNPENINIFVPGSKKKSPPKKKPAPLPSKRQISRPCLFQHVTSVAAKDKSTYMSLQTLIDNEIIKKKENIS